MIPVARPEFLKFREAGKIPYYNRRLIIMSKRVGDSINVKIMYVGGCKLIYVYVGR